MQCFTLDQATFTAIDSARALAFRTAWSFRVHELKLTAAALWMQLNTGFIGYLFDDQKPKRPKSKYREVL